ncbi:MAG TPA: DUF5995 family protein [Chitinophagaceae bacterium]|nr:DUF5995 family protein [Chitinophagaceae bacterium]
MAVNTINQVLETLAEEISTSIKINSRAGYFAALYYKVTSRVKAGIENGEFEDGPRMEKLDVMFANRYLDALDGWKNKKTITSSWQWAFETVEKSSALVLQHLLLGINAHINLDLGIAAAMVMQDAPIIDINRDFNTINTIIASLTYEVLNDISRISPLLSLLGLRATKNVSVLVEFSIDNARDGAWCFAEDLSRKTGDDFLKCIGERDKSIAQLAMELVQVKGFIRFTRWLIHLFEWKEPSKIIRVLHDYKKTYFSFANKEITPAA